MTTQNKHFIIPITSIAIAAILTACGGGGGGSTPPTGGGGSATPIASASPHASTNPVASASPTVSPSPSASPINTQGSATVTGTVVDYAADTPKSGVKVSISAYTAGATATQVATTTSTGTFSFNTSPGTYYLIIGSDSPTDTTTTLHTKIVVNAGANPLTLPIPPAETDVTYTAAQLSGNFRLTALSGDQLSCFTGANAGRASLSLTAFIPDEILTEYSTAFSQEAATEAVGEPTPLFNNGFIYETQIGGIPPATAFSEGGDNNNCAAYTDTFSFNSANTAQYAAATNATYLYFGANELQINAFANSGGLEVWATDPR